MAAVVSTAMHSLSHSTLWLNYKRRLCTSSAPIDTGTVQEKTGKTREK